MLLWDDKVSWNALGKSIDKKKEKKKNKGTMTPISSVIYR